jgi:hypothetical protein
MAYAAMNRNKKYLRSFFSHLAHIEGERKEAWLIKSVVLETRVRDGGAD